VNQLADKKPKLSSRREIDLSEFLGNVGEGCIRIHHHLSELLARRGRFILGLRRLEPRILGDTLPGLKLAVEALALLLELVVGLTELGDGLFGEQFLESPFLNVLLFVLLELGDEADGPL
jgi:hypothetical protein